MRQSPPVRDTVITWTALIVVRRRSKARVAGINIRAAGQQLVREGWAAIILQWTKHRIGIDLVAVRREKAAAVVIAEIVTERAHRTGSTVEIGTQIAGIQDSASDRHRRAAVIDGDGKIFGDDCCMGRRERSRLRTIGDRHSQPGRS